MVRTYLPGMNEGRGKKKSKYLTPKQAIKLLKQDPEYKMLVALERAHNEGYKQGYEDGLPCSCHPEGHMRECYLSDKNNL